MTSLYMTDWDPQQTLRQTLWWDSCFLRTPSCKAQWVSIINQCGSDKIKNMAFVMVPYGTQRVTAWMELTQPVYTRPDTPPSAETLTNLVLALAIRMTWHIEWDDARCKCPRVLIGCDYIKGWACCGQWSIIISESLFKWSLYHSVRNLTVVVSTHAHTVVLLWGCINQGRLN